VKALLNHISEDIGIPASNVALDQFVADMEEIEKRIQVRHETLALSDAEFELSIKNLMRNVTPRELNFLSTPYSMKSQAAI
jgi:hypothetical protein